ncbi:unnamed protein product [Cladocopium goreaui]|uniref:Uncharacterized protein n=1 Tax=Cladocopium goreaui TaxID=2562237 RepID=A0A9P1G1N6_9DINO|nr:unnamed protein product [Cladocopium goreaui]
MARSSSIVAPLLVLASVALAVFSFGPDAFVAAPQAVETRALQHQAASAMMGATFAAAASPLPALAARVEEEDEGFDLRILAVLALPLFAVSWALFNVWRVAFRQVFSFCPDAFVAAPQAVETRALQPLGCHGEIMVGGSRHQAASAMMGATFAAAASPLPALAARVEEEDEGFDLRILAVLALPLFAVSWALFNVWRVAFRQVFSFGPDAFVAAPQAVETRALQPLGCHGEIMVGAIRHQAASAMMGATFAAAASPLPALAARVEEEDEGFDLRILAVLALPLFAVSWALFNVWRVAFRQAGCLRIRTKKT